MSTHRRRSAEARAFDRHVDQALGLVTMTRPTTTSSRPPTIVETLAAVASLVAFVLLGTFLVVAWWS